MKDIKILFILQVLVFIKVNSSLFDEIDSELYERENKKCMIAFYPPSEDDDKCVGTSLSSELTGKNKGKCCKISIDFDPFIDYKERYKGNWKEVIIKELDLDENITEEEIRNKYFPTQKDNSCFLFPDIIKDLLLYQYSLWDINGEVEYNCGNGKEIFKAKDYHPTNEKEIFEKEFMDCDSEFTEKNCHKRCMKLFSDDVQCCWCESNYFYPIDNEANKRCRLFKNSTMKEELKTELEKSLKNDERIEYKCDCYDKNGKNVKASYNTANGEVLIE